MGISGKFKLGTRGHCALLMACWFPAAIFAQGSVPSTGAPTIGSQGDPRLVPLSQLQQKNIEAGPLLTAPVARPPFAQAVDNHVRALMQAEGVPGLSIAMVVDGKLAYANGYGLAHRNHNFRTTSDTLFNLASVSKPLTAVAALRLAEMGRLDLFAPVQKYVPSFPQKQWPVNCFHLLTHQSGIRHYQGRESLSTAPFSDVIAPLEIFQNDPLVHQPGTALLYTSYGYNLLGAAMQGAAGLPYLACMEHLVFKPSNMHNVRVVDGTLDERVQATGYIKRPEGLVNAPLINATNKIPSGGYLASAHDVGNFMSSLVSGKLLSEKTMKGMLRPRQLSNGKFTPYGMGWQVGNWGTTPVASHGGKQPGFSAQIYVAPEKKFGMVVLANLENVKLIDLVYLSRNEAMQANSDQLGH